MTINEQSDRIDRVDWDALIILDAGRYDEFIKRGEKHLPVDDADRVSNGEIGFTAVWMPHQLYDDYDGVFFHGGQPIYSMEGGGTWDEREHFTHVPHYTEYEWDTDVGTCWPATVNGVVRDHADPEDQIVVRYLCPHPPFPDMPDLTRGRGNRTRQIASAVRSGDMTVEAVRASYGAWYEYGLEAAADIADWTDGTAAVTADHGTCTGDCGQWFHGPVGNGGHNPHDHLVEVPWLLIE